MTPVPPLAAYEAWRAERPARGKARNTMSGRQYRQIVLGLRAGNSFPEIAAGLGFRHNAVRDAYDRLPDHLK